MRVVLFPNTPDQQVVQILGSAATLGRAEGNTVLISGKRIADFHVRITCENGNWEIEDIAGQNDIVLNGNQIEKAQLSVGSRILIGDASLLVTSLDIDEEQIMAVPATVGEEAHRFVNSPYSTNLPYPIIPQNPAVTSILPRMALVFSLCGPFLLGIGWLVGGILGVVSLFRDRITRTGRKIAWWALVIALFWVIGMSGVVVFFSWSHLRDTIIAKNEANVESLLKAVAVSQYFVKYAELYDADKDENSEYANFDELQDVNYHILRENLSESPLLYGYRFKIKRADEAGFVSTAVPVKYSITGRKTYYIDENGILFEEDLKGTDFEESPLKLTEQDQTKTVLETVGNELAGDLARIAEKAFKNAEYTRCKRIITNIRKRFPQSAAAKKLNTLEKDATPFIVEFKSKELYERVETLIAGKKLDAAITTMRSLIKQYPGSSIAGGTKKKLTELTEIRAWQDMDLAEKYMSDKQADRALATLQGIEKKYPEAYLIAKLKDLIANCKTQVMKMLEEEVAKVLEEAHKLEAENKHEEAFLLYSTIKNRYGSTAAAKGIDEVLNKCRKMINEQVTTHLIEEILELKLKSDTPRILSLIELLERSYSQTDGFKNNKETLDGLKHKTQAFKYITAAREQLRNESYRSALVNLELAIKEDPGIEITMKEELEQCYMFLADAAFANQNYEMALENYQHYILLQPRYSRINEGKLLLCHFQQAKAAYQNKKYAEAEKHLLACAEAYGTQPEYNFIYGRILINMGKWEEAVVRFSSSITSDVPFAHEARLYWALSQYRHALEEEELLRKMLVEDAELMRIISSYGIKFDVTARTNAQETMFVATVNKSNAKTKTFADLTSALCTQLDDLANDAEKLVHMDKDKTDLKRAQRTKIRTRIQELPGKLSVMRACQSADVYRKIKISEQLEKVRKLYLKLNQAMTSIAGKKRTPEMVKVITLLTEKIAELRSAEESFKMYIGLEEQRQRRAVAIIANFSDRLSANSANASVLKTNADDLRDLYTSIKETELVVSALRNIAKSYAIIPNMSNIILTEPSTADKADKVIPVDTTAIQRRKNTSHG